MLFPGRCQDGVREPAHPRGPGVRPRRRAARGGHRAARAGLRAGRRRHRQDPHDHPADRAPRAHRTRRARPGPRGHVHRAGGGGDAHPAARARASPGCRPARSTPPRCASCATSGRGGRRASSGSCWRASCGSSGRPRRGLSAGTDAASLRDLAGEIEWAKASLVTPDDYPAAVARLRRDTPGPAEQVAAVYAGYEALKNRAELLDFDDLLLHTAAALEEHAGVAEEFRDRYRCFVVDEYQDVTPLQQRVLDAWLGERDDLTVVGDANQTIYTFAGATPRYLLDFPRRFPEAVVVRLHARLPLHPAGRGRGQHADRRGARAGSAGTRLQLVGQLPPGPEPRLRRVRRRAGRGRRRRAADRAADRRRHPGREIAVLFRINAQSEVYEQALTEVGVPYQVRGGERFFSRPEVRRAMTAVAGRRRRSTPRWSTPCVPCSAPSGSPPSRPAVPPQRAQWESLLALVELAEELRRGRAGGRPAPVLRRAGRPAPTPRTRPTVQGVTLASLHAAKGLEWDVVFLVGLVDGTLPIQHAEGDDEAIEEERRLLYVGITRARRLLSLSWALSRQPGGPRRRRRSRFLYGLIPDEHPASRVAEPVPRRRQAALPGLRLAAARREAMKLRRCADCPSDVDVELLDRLQGLAGGRGEGTAGPGVRGLHRRHAHRHRRAPPGRQRRAGARSRASARASSTGTATAVLGAGRRGGVLDRRKLPVNRLCGLRRAVPTVIVRRTSPARLCHDHHPEGGAPMITMTSSVARSTAPVCAWSPWCRRTRVRGSSAACVLVVARRLREPTTAQVCPQRSVAIGRRPSHRPKTKAADPTGIRGLFVCPARPLTAGGSRC